MNAAAAGARFASELSGMDGVDGVEIDDDQEPPSIAEQTEQWATNLRDGNRWLGRDGSRHGSRSPRRSPRGSSRRR